MLEIKRTNSGVYFHDSHHFICTFRVVDTDHKDGQILI